jgi:hypothetical protein
MHTGGRGAPLVSPREIFEKLSHKNAIKHDPPPLIFSKPQVPPSKEFAKKTQRPPWISNYCAAIPCLFPEFVSSSLFLLSLLKIRKALILAWGTNVQNINVDTCKILKLTRLLRPTRTVNIYCF